MNNNHHDSRSQSPLWNMISGIFLPQPRPQQYSSSFGHDGRSDYSNNNSYYQGGQYYQNRSPNSSHDTYTPVIGISSRKRSRIDPAVNDNQLTESLQRIVDTKNALQAEVNQLMNSNQLLQSSVEQLEAERVHLLDTHQQMEMLNMSQNDTIENLNNDIRDQEQTINEQNNKIAILYVNNEEGKENALQLLHQIATMSKESSDQQTMLTTRCDTLMNRLEEVTQANTALTTANGTLTDQLEERTQANTALTTANGTLTNQLHVFTQANTALTTRNDTLMNRLEERTQANTALTTRNGTLTDQLEERTQANTALTTTNGTLTNQLHVFTQANTALTTRNDTLMNRLKEFTQANTALTTRNATLMNRLKEVTQANTALTTRNGTLTNQLHEFTQANTALTTTNDNMTRDQQLAYGPDLFQFCGSQPGNPYSFDELIWNQFRYTPFENLDLSKLQLLVQQHIKNSITHKIAIQKLCTIIKRIVKEDFELAKHLGIKNTPNELDNKVLCRIIGGDIKEVAKYIFDHSCLPWYHFVALDSDVQLDHTLPASHIYWRAIDNFWYFASKNNKTNLRLLFADVNRIKSDALITNVIMQQDTQGQIYLVHARNTSEHSRSAYMSVYRMMHSRLKALIEKGHVSILKASAEKSMKKKAMVFNT
jgi:predicted nuclease with TOPRIM domain